MPWPAPRLPRWRVLSLLAVPHTVLLGALWAGSLSLTPRGLAAAGGWHWLSLALVAALVLSLALATASDSPPLRTLAYAVYAMAVGLVFGGGVVLGFLNAAGGMDGSSPGPPWITVLHAAGAVLSVTSLLGLAMIVRADLLLDQARRQR